MISQKHKGWRNPWVFGLLAIILAGVLVNGRFLWNALHHPMRLLDDNYNVKAHNKYDAKWVQEQAERSTLGWQAKLHSSHQLQNDSMATPDAARFILLASPADLKLALNDHDGQPVHGLKVEVDAQWPADPAFDFKGSMYEAAAGHYEGSLKFPRPGNWDLLIRAKLEDRQFHMEQKVFVAIPKQ
ncbi:MAG: FixH family protein [Nitrosomonadales bacterium]|nr:FixH family protein [Nitrosomonadales bacterium]